MTRPRRPRPWREVLGIGEGDPVTSLSIKQRYLDSIAKAHPAVEGGSQAQVDEINAAYRAAHEELLRS